MKNTKKEEYIFTDSRGNVYKMDCRDREDAFQFAYKCGLCCHGSTTNLILTGNMPVPAT